MRVGPKRSPVWRASINRLTRAHPVLEEATVLTLFRDIALVAFLISAVTFMASLFVYRRRDVSIGAFFLAGPLVVLRPSRYLRSGKWKIPPALFILTMISGVVVWFAGWAVNNL